MTAPRCPECRKALIVLELHGVEVDHCVQCGGTWLDAGELELLLERAGVGPRRIREALRTKARGPREGRRCPRCRRRLRRLAIGDTAAIELDRCDLGHGLWFDRGEMEAVVRLLGEGELGVVAGFFSEVYRHQLGAGGRSG